VSVRLQQISNGQNQNEKQNSAKQNAKIHFLRRITFAVCIVSVNLLMLLGKIVAIYFDNHSKHVNTLFEGRAVFLALRSSAEYAKQYVTARR
jgi:hypothetical protein